MDKIEKNNRKNFSYLTQKNSQLCQRLTAPIPTPSTPLTFFHIIFTNPWQQYHPLFPSFFSSIEEERNLSPIPYFSCKRSFGGFSFLILMVVEWLCMLVISFIVLVSIEAWWWWYLGVESVAVWVQLLSTFLGEAVAGI